MNKDPKIIRHHENARAAMAALLSNPKVFTTSVGTALPDVAVLAHDMAAMMESELESRQDARDLFVRSTSYEAYDFDLPLPPEHGPYPDGMPDRLTGTIYFDDRCERASVEFDEETELERHLFLRQVDAFEQYVRDQYTKSGL